MKKLKLFLPIIMIFAFIFTITACKKKTKYYNIVFTDYDDSFIDLVVVKEGAKPVYTGDLPTRKADDDYTYAFSCWYPFITKATEDTVYKAMYMKTEKPEYTITFKNGEDTLDVVKVKENEIPEYSGENPEKAPSNGVKYKFNGWSPKITGAKENTTYEATFIEEDLPSYTVKFYNEDGTTLLDSVEVKEGFTPEYSKEVPTKASDDMYKYTFSGWNPKLKAATKDTSYIALFKQEVLAHSLSFNLDGGENVSGKKIEALYTEEITPDLFNYGIVKENQKFIGWSYNGTLIFDESGNTKCDLNTIVFDKECEFKATYDDQAFVNIKYVFYSPVTKSPVDYFSSLSSNYGTISKSNYYDWNTKVSLTSRLDSHYKFDGWYENNSLLSSEKDCYYYLFDKDVNIEARFTYEDEHINILSYDGTFGKVMVKDDTDWSNDISIDSYYSKEVTLVAKGLTNYPFLGWFDFYGSLISEDEFYIVTMDCNVNLVAKWDRFKITYNVYDGENNASNPAYYSTTDNIELLAATPGFGKEFICWKYENTSIRTIDTTKLKNITIDACYEKLTLFRMFEFDSTTRTITGVVDKTITSAVIPTGFLAIGHNAFEDCTNLSTITMQTPYTLTSIGKEAFYNCSSLSSFTMPVDLENLGENAFGYCSSLTSLTIPSNIEEIPDGLCYGCTSLKAINFLGDKTSIGRSAFGNCGFTSFVIPQGVTTIGSYAFAGCSSLAGINMSDNLTSIGEGAFEGCSALKSITIPNSVNEIGKGILSGCNALESLKTPFIGEKRYVATDLVQYPLGYFFDGYNDDQEHEYTYQANQKYQSSTNSFSTKIYWLPSALKTVELTDCTNIQYGAFDDVDYVETIKLSNKITAIGGNAFNGCQALKSILLSNALITIGEYAFGNCSNLESILLPDTLTTIGKNAFNYCSKLTTIIIPSKVTVLPEWLFAYCSNLESITILGNVTTIDSYTFGYLTKLESLTLPGSITSIASYAFFGCTALTDFNFDGYTSQWNSISKGDYWSMGLAATEVKCKNNQTVTL